MSCYEWEEGAFSIPSTEWPKFKESLRTAFNTDQKRLFQLATTLHGQLVESGKGKRGFGFHVELNRLLEARQRNRNTASMPYSDYASLWALEQVLLAEGKPRRPLQKDFPLATNKTREFNADEGVITLSIDKDRRVGWSVPDNNHACESARESVMGRAFFAALHRVKWTRGSGGSIVGNDEYNRDSRGEGGGGNYTKDRFGPESKAKPGRRSVVIGRGMYR